MPPIVMMEPTNLCNLKCPLCPSGTGTLKRPRGFMDMDIYRKIIDEIAPHSSMLILWNQGEPFLHPQFLQMVRYAADRRLFTLASTNAGCLPDAEDIVRSGLHSLIVSLDGATQETYNKYRVNGDLATVLAGVRALVAAKRRLHSPTPIIKWQFLVLKHNEHEIEQIRRLAREIGVDSLQFKTAQIYSKEDVDTYLPLNPKYRRYKVVDGDFELKFGIANRCRRLWTQPVVNQDGRMAVCCFDKDNDVKVGDVHSHSLRELWHGPAFKRMRRIILTNRASVPMCRNCGEGVRIQLKQRT
ncbi:MAG: SPASM domain-containing protein [Candidatus Cloacimonetes bacterium]|nr:SPASM domain-containing protein [Candidatus Cloacimonadota bacterium]